MPDKPTFDARRVGGLLAELLAALPEPGSRPRIASATARRLRAEIGEAIARLGKFGEDLDPVKRPESMLDPSNPQVIGRLIASTLIQQPRRPLGGLEKFYGAGVYALYYNGPFPAYAPVAGKDIPLYIGKADPERPDADTAEAQGVRLHGRLTEHARSIGSAENLDVADFDCRFLVVKSAWQSTSENLPINRFRPVWNNEVKVCYGFGKHGDAHGTRRNERSPWDTLHPGRKWATKDGNVPNKRDVEEIIADIRKHFATTLPNLPADL